jgi:hypothetical protein
MMVAILNIRLYTGTTSGETYRPLPISPMTAVESVLTASGIFTVEDVYDLWVPLHHGLYPLLDDL